MGADGGGAGGCRHCVVRDAHRRGLCTTCYSSPAIRAKYAAISPRREGLSEAEAVALPPSWGEEGTPPPAAYVPPAEKRQLGDLAAQWAGVGATGAFDLHPETEPDAIRATQRRDVAEARRRLGPTATAAEIGADVCLPTWSVERLLKELEGGPP